MAACAASRRFLATLAAELTCNEHGSDLIGRLHRAGRARGRRARGLPGRAGAATAGGHEHQGRVGLGQEHDASAAAAAGRGARAGLERLRGHQPRHLAQVPPRLRDARRREQVRGGADRPRAQADRPEARSLHGAKGRARWHVTPADRPLPVRQLRARSRRGGGQPAAHPLRPSGLHVLHDHAPGGDGRARLGARSAGRPLQGGRRPARAQRRSLHRHAAGCSSPGPPRRTRRSTTSSSTTTCPKASGRGRSRSAPTAR